MTGADENISGMHAPEPAALLVVVFCALVVVAIATVTLRRHGVGALSAIGVAAIAGSTAVQALPIQAGGWDAALYAAGFPLVCVTYPDGRVASRWLAIPLFAALGFAAVAVITAGAVIAQPWWTVAMCCQIPLAAVAIHRYRRRLATPERERMRWAMLGLVVLFGTMLPLAVLAAVVGNGTIASLGDVAESMATLAVGAFPVALGIGLVAPGTGTVVRVDPLLHAVVFALAAGWSLAGVFAVALAAARGVGSAGDGPVWGAAAVLAVAVIPILLASRWLAGWLVYGVRPAPAAAARRLHARLAGLSPTDDIAGVIEQETAAAIGSPDVRLHAPEEADAAAGTPIRYQGETLATIHVAPRPTESTLTVRDQRVVTALAAQAAPALHGARAVRALIDARSSLVLARAEERKHLRRDLHDDLAPTLAGLGLGLSALRELAPPGLHALIDEVQLGVREAITRTRQLTRGLRPAILDDRGLAEALRERSRLLDGAGIHAILDVEDPGPLPAATEVAVLLIAQEAVSNAVRHSRASRCEITLRREPAALRLVVEDNGTGYGMGGPAAPGIGVESMRDRATELGGRTTISSGPSGTRVAVRLPLLPDAAGTARTDAADQKEADREHCARRR
ncbi:MAG: hypothetical protein BGO26_15275 [Actinobacteria bacterium 69-20]|nr:MAG: hypothetical protein BGO26_15275 [Actinobacteria bacterium 69-20]